MDNGFDYKESASQLAFQVRPLVPSEYKVNEKDIQNIIYSESIYWGEKLSELNQFDSITSHNIIQIIAEWTFYKYIDILIISLSEAIRKDIIREINCDLYNYLINTHTKEPISEYPSSYLKEVEKIVKESYKKYLKLLKSTHKISKNDYNILIKQSHFDKVSNEIANKNLYTVPISIFDILKTQAFWSLAYIITLPVFLLGSLIYLNKCEMEKGIIYLIIFCFLLFRFITKEIPISITIPEDKPSKD